MDYDIFDRSPEEQPIQGFDCFFDSDKFTVPTPQKISIVPFLKDDEGSIYKIEPA